jgi:hypothetical protein
MKFIIAFLLYEIEPHFWLVLQVRSGVARKTERALTPAFGFRARFSYDDLAGFI